MDQDNTTNNTNNIINDANDQEEIRDEIFEAAKKLEEEIDASSAKFEEESKQSLDRLEKGIVAAENELGDFYEDMDKFVDKKASQADGAIDELNKAEPEEEAEELAA